MPVVTRDLDALLGTVGEAMTKDVVFVSPDMELPAAARLLEMSGVSGAPVIDGRKLVGIVTLHDLFSRVPVPAGPVETHGPFHRWEHVLAELSHRSALTVADVMTHRVVSVEPEASIAEAARQMAEHRLSRLPVIDAGGTLCGIVSRDDVVRTVAEAGV